MDPSLFQDNLVLSNRILYTPSSFAKSNLFHLQEVGSLQAKQPHISQRKDLTSYLFFIVIKGSGRLDYNGHTYSLMQNSCVFLDCRQLYRHESSLQLWNLKWVHFHGPNLNAIYQKYKERGGQPSFKTSQPQRFEDILDSLFEIAASNSYVRDMKICEQLTSLLTLLMEAAWNPGCNAIPSAKIQNTQQIKDYLDMHFQQKITLDQLSELFFINKFYLSRIFTEQFGISINGYLTQIRITHAKQLLRFTTQPIKKIAGECGFSDPNYFARTFRKIEGLSPGEFRKRW